MSGPLRLALTRVLALVVAGSATAGAEPPPAATATPRSAPVSATVSAQELRRAVILGVLGARFGSLVTIEATVKGPDRVPSKRDQGKVFLVIDRVDGRALQPPVVLQLRGAPPDEVSRLPALARVRLLGYETGAFEGIPAGLFRHVPAFAGVGYHFAHWFSFVKRLDR